MSTSEVLSSAISTENLYKVSTEPTADVPLLPDAPAWLTKGYLERCLRSHCQDKNLKIRKIHARPALGKGENYGGVLTRVRAEFVMSNGHTKTGHYLIKSSFEGDETARETMAPYDIFNREMSIYENVLPKLKALLRDINDDEEIFAETVAVDYENSALVFEDLSMRDYVMPDRLRGLDMPLIKLVLRKLAKMHATTALLNEREGGSLEGYDCGFYNYHTDNYAPCWLGNLDACSRLVSQWQGFEEYGRKLAELKPWLMTLGKRVFEPTLGHLNVLAHGDLWTNNVLVKYDKETGAPQDVIIIDFQYAAWGSPAIDLFYLFNTSLEEEMHLHKQEELIQYYYNYLADTLKKLAYKAKIPSLHKFHIHMEEKAFYAFTSTCIVQPIQRVVDTEDADFNALMQSDERAKRFKESCYTNPYCQRMIRQLLPIYERKGLLETDQ